MDTKTLGKREKNRIANRLAILTAARECFSEHSYDQVTVRDIIRRTGLASGTFYNYFPDKQSIFSALLDDYLLRLDANLKLKREESKTLEDFIYNTYLAVFSTIAEDPIVYQLAHYNEKIIRDLFGTDIMGKNMESLENDISDAVNRGLIPPIDQGYLSAAFFGVASEIGLRISRSVHSDVETAAKFAQKLFMGGIPKIAATAPTARKMTYTSLEPA
ncbi:MAG: TetR/AcrR family transcriptional regulator [Hahellaceae bacterium]|nr:TetR/AcrR family transcriptional regulator [Hahellaceae bacterium]